MAEYCLALVPRSNFPAMGVVCKGWRSFIQSKEFTTVRKLAGMPAMIFPMLSQTPTYLDNSLML